MIIIGKLKIIEKNVNEQYNNCFNHIFKKHRFIKINK